MKGTWGGRREGSGRKPTGKNIVNITLTLTKDEAKLLKEIAKSNELSVSRLIAKYFNLTELTQKHDDNSVKNG